MLKGIILQKKGKPRKTSIESKKKKKKTKMRKNHFSLYNITNDLI